jgi:transposase
MILTISKEKVMEILETYDLTGSYRSTAQLCGVDHHTVKRYVAARAAGVDPAGSGTPRGKVSDPFLERIEAWVDRSKGQIRADRVHAKLVEVGYTGSERTTRRVVAAVKRDWRRENGRVFRPWLPEPGLWLQYDYGDGPVVAGRATVLFCAWLAWSRFRVVIPLADKTLPSVITALDRTFRVLGGAPTYVLTDNERTVTTDRVAGVPVKNRAIVAAGVFYGVAIRTCQVADPESKGGSEATVKLAKADLVPTDLNLRGDYADFAALEAACREFMDRVNHRPHRATGRPPVEMLAEEQTSLHPVPAGPFTMALGESRAVSWSSTVAYQGARYSVPHVHRDTNVWVRTAGDEVIIAATDTTTGGGAVEIARHPKLSSGQASIRDEHYPPRREPADTRPRAQSSDEEAFLALGDGARQWLIEAAGVGTRRIRVLMAEAVELTAVHGSTVVDQALGLAAVNHRFEPGDLASIIARHNDPPRRASSTHSLQNPTTAWAALGSSETPEEQR